MKTNKKDIQYVSNVDRVSYTLRELSRAALRDVARMLKYKIRQEFNKLPGMKKQNKRFKAAYQHWLRKRCYLVQRRKYKIFLLSFSLT